MKERDAFIQSLKDYLLIILGSVVTGFALNIFLVPHKIAPGGIAGIATIIFYLSGEMLPVGSFMLLLNIPLFISGIKFIGRKFIVRTLFGTILLSAVVDFADPLTGWIIERLALERLDAGPDYLLYAIFGGSFMGLGLGLVFKSGATTGGTDLAAKIVHRLIPSLSVGKALLFIDGAVIIFAAVSFNSFLLALYSIIALYISSKVIDIILEGMNFAKVAYIITEHADEIADGIMKELDRGVTALHATGMYTRTDKRVLFCVLQRGQISELKSLVKRYDPSAFFILGDVTEVLGEGFKMHEQ